MPPKAVVAGYIPTSRRLAVPLLNIPLYYQFSTLQSSGCYKILKKKQLLYFFENEVEHLYIH